MAPHGYVDLFEPAIWAGIATRRSDAPSNTCKRSAAPVFLTRPVSMRRTQCTRPRQSPPRVARAIVGDRRDLQRERALIYAHAGHGESSAPDGSALLYGRCQRVSTPVPIRRPAIVGDAAILNDGGRPCRRSVQDHAICRIGRRLLIWIAVAAAKVHVEVARRIRLNLHERAAQLDVAHRVVRIDDEHAH